MLLHRINSDFFLTEIEIIKKEVNREFADGLVVRIQCICCCCLDSVPVGGLRSLKLCSEAKRITKETKQKNEPNRDSVA